MRRSTESTHVLKLIPDYTLGLLPGDDADRVAAHLSFCGECRQALVAEQAIGRAMKTSIIRASTPDRARLQALMPVPPNPTRVRGRWSVNSPGIAAIALMLVLAFGVLALFANQQRGAWSLSAPTAQATAVLLTDTPTQTATREMTATVAGSEALLSRANSAPGSSDRQTISPAPAIIPVPAASLLH